ncbi:radical SAM protein [Thermosipho sp. (in: thermotogales)]|uniref:radical SAM protein n=1 Tax=Thermosipho sp. (in: thermotogales) TaxID=1968895 RepID=UPI00257F5965|nr:radical SAM protein [Thermosipho sp. (in: thermotogales)]MBZ4649276.1 radical domain protein [Thermosipho sp. (in: thermotogales)]
MDVVLSKSINKIVPYIKAIKHNGLNAPISLHILLTDHCVNKCNMCSHWKTQDKSELDFEVIKKIWQESNDYGVESICLTGGDPVLYSRFEDLLKLKRSFKLGIITSGNFKKGFDYSLISDLDFIRFSLDSLDSEKYHVIRGRNNLDEILNNLYSTLKYNENVGINFTIQKLNISEVVDIIELVVKNKLKRLILYPVHHAEGLELTHHDKLLLANLLNFMIDTRRVNLLIPENNLQFLHDWLCGKIKFKKPHSEVPCIINKIHLAIDAKGNVYPCETQVDDTDIQYRENSLILGNVYNESFIDIWEENYHKEFASDKCKLCFSRYMPINEAYDELKDKQIFI